MRANSSDRVAVPSDGILWHDGLLLAPVHFQQLTQRHEDLVAYHVRSSSPYAWGVRRLQLQPGKLGQNVIAVAQLEAVLPDGLLVSRDERQSALQLKLSDAQLDRLRAPGERCTIYLAVPVEGKGQTAGPRLRNIEGDEEELCRVQPDARLVTETDLSPGAESHLPLLRLKFEKQQLQVEAFLPPLLDIDLIPLNGQPALRIAAQALYRRLADTERQLAAVAAECGERLRRLELREQLHCLCAGLPQLGGTLLLDTVTPLQLYLALAHVLGHLAILRDLSEPAPEAPPYDHRDLRRTFDLLFALIDARLDTIERRCSELAFEPSQQGYSLLLGTEMLQGWPTRSLVAGTPADGAPVLLVGLRGLAAADAEQWMANASIASAQQMDDVRERRVRGALRYQVDAQGGLVLLAAERDPLSAVSAPTLSIDAEGLRTAGTTLFAITPDPQLVRAGQKLMLEVPSGAAPEEVVLLIAVEAES